MRWRVEKGAVLVWTPSVALVGGGGVYHVFVSWFRVPRVPWDRRLLVESMVFTAYPPLGAHRGAEILEPGVLAEHNLYLQSLRMP